MDRLEVITQVIRQLELMDLEEELLPGEPEEVINDEN